MRGQADRAPAVAGKFYPGDSARLAPVVDKLLAGAKERSPEPWPAAMVPHAGLSFSGHIAAGVLKRIAIPKTVIVIGPNHTGRGMEWAVAPHQTWALPGMTVASDFILARRLCQAIPGLEMDAVAHQQEHAIEVELPLLARLAPEVKVVGITIGHGDLAGCRRFAKGLAEVMRDPRARTAAAAHLQRHEPFRHRRREPPARRPGPGRAGSRDPGGVYDTVTSNNISMCGVLPAVIVLETLKLLGGSHEGRAGWLRHHRRT